MVKSKHDRLKHHWPNVDSESAGRSEDALDRVGDRLRPAVDRVERFVQEHPGVALGAAAISGLLLGWMVKRK